MIKNNKFLQRYIWIFFLLFLMADFVQSNYHYSNLTLDGDIARVAAPMIWYQNVLDDPIGITAITTGEKYSGAGRFVCHWVTKWWFTAIPDFLHLVIKDPVQAVFYTSTLLVALLHLLFVWLAYQYAKGKDAFDIKNFVVIALLSSVLIQYNNYYGQIGLIDRSIDYVLFYALPIFVLLYYFLPFYKYQKTKKEPTNFSQIILFLLAPILAFSGPLVQPVVFIIFMIYCFAVFVKNPFLKIDRSNKLLFQFSFLVLCCVYAFYVSKYNSESSEALPLVERYTLLAEGLFQIINFDRAWLYILIGIGINFYILLKQKFIEPRTLKSILFFTIIFCGIYLLLLPLGGYRGYRPYIIRYDTFIPVTISFIFLLVFTTYTLITKLHSRSHIIYLIGLLGFCFIFFWADKNTERENNYCQQGQLYEIANNQDTVVRQKIVCNLLTWQEEDLLDGETTRLINVCLHRWGILKEYQRVEFYKSE